MLDFAAHDALSPAQMTHLQTYFSTLNDAELARLEDDLDFASFTGALTPELRMVLYALNDVETAKAA